MKRRRSWLDWTTLSTDLVARIGDLLLADDAADFVRLRAVCHPWRDSTADLKSRADIVIPRHWILLSAPKRSQNFRTKTHPFVFFNFASNKYFSTEVSLIRDGYIFEFHANCFLLLKKTATQARVLLNPFTGFLMQLPSILISKGGKPAIPFSDLLFGGYVTSTATLFFWMNCMSGTRLVWKNPCSDTWFYADLDIRCYDYCFDKDFLYGIEFYKGLVRINLAGEIASEPVVEIVAHIPKIPADKFIESSCVFDCEGTIILVNFLNDDSGDIVSYENFDVLKFDMKKRRFVRTGKINDHAFFISREKNFAISCKKLDSIPANSIYLCNLDSDDTVHYDLSKDLYKSWPPKSCSRLLKQLVKYCLD